ncbi:MAG: hypothetical protein NY202_03355 [Mollicutes bacterium UO1]
MTGKVINLEEETKELKSAIRKLKKEIGRETASESSSSEEEATSSEEESSSESSGSESDDDSELGETEREKEERERKQQERQEQQKKPVMFFDELFTPAERNNEQDLILTSKQTPKPEKKQPANPTDRSD